MLKDSPEGFGWMRLMPKLNGKHYPYTTAGRAAYKAAKRRANGGSTSVARNTSKPKPKGRTRNA